LKKHLQTITILGYWVLVNLKKCLKSQSTISVNKQNKISWSNYKKYAKLHRKETMITLAYLCETRRHMAYIKPK
jgi:hypothetical protein